MAGMQTPYSYGQKKTTPEPKKKLKAKKSKTYSSSPSRNAGDRWIG